MTTDPRVNAKGDILVGVGDNEVAIVPVGLPTQVLTADPTRLPGVSWQDAPSGGGGGGGLLGRTDTGPFIGTFGPCGNTGLWTVCPAAFRSLPIAAEAGDVLDWRFGAVLGAVVNSADGEFDLATINNSNPLLPVILRCLSSGTDTPLANGFGGMYCWANNARRFAGCEDWETTSGDIVAGSVTFALLYRSGATGLSIGHGTVYPSRVSVLNLGKVPA